MCNSCVFSRKIIYLCLVSHVSGLVENFNIGIFSDTINVIDVKHCIKVLLLHIELYLFTTLTVIHYTLMTLILFQGHSSVTQTVLNLKISCSYPIKLKLCRIVKYIEHIMNVYHYFCQLTSTHIQQRFWCVFLFDKIFIIGSVTDTVQLQARFFKLCIIITVLLVHQFVPGLITLNLLQNHRCVRTINCKFKIFFFDSCLL